MVKVVPVHLSGNGFPNCGTKYPGICARAPNKHMTHFGVPSHVKLPTSVNVEPYGTSKHVVACLHPKADKSDSLDFTEFARSSADI